MYDICRSTNIEVASRLILLLGSGLYILFHRHFGLTPPQINPVLMGKHQLIGSLRAVKRRAVIHQRVSLPILLTVYRIFSMSTVTAVNRPVALCLVSFMHHCLVTINKCTLKARTLKHRHRESLGTEREYWDMNISPVTADNDELLKDQSDSNVLTNNNGEIKLTGVVFLLCATELSRN